MSTSTVRSNVIYALGEGQNISDTTFLAYALRWVNAAYREVFLRYRFKSLRTKAIFRTTAGQQTYQVPSDFMGFLTLKDESNGEIVNQITPEEFQRTVDGTKITDESFESDSDVAVELAHTAIQQYSETVTDTTGATTYTRDTDYTMAYAAGTITVLSTGSMVDATDYYIDYVYRETGKPTDFCVDFDATNGLWVFRLNPVPDATYIGSLLYSALPSELSTTVDPIWSQFEYALERGGIYYGSMELIADPQKRQEYRGLYEAQIQALIQLDNELNTKHQPIKVVMKRSAYY